MKNRILIAVLMLGVSTSLSVASEAIEKKVLIVENYDSFSENVTLVSELNASETFVATISEKIQTTYLYKPAVNPVIDMPCITHIDPGRNNMLFNLYNTHFTTTNETNSAGASSSRSKLYRIRSLQTTFLKTHTILLLDPGWITSNAMC